MVRLEVSSSAAIASAVSGLRVRLSTWMIWNSRSARLMERLLGRSDRAVSDADRMLAAGGFYKGTTLKAKRILSHVDHLRLRVLDLDDATADTMVAAGSH